MSILNILSATDTEIYSDLIVRDDLTVDDNLIIGGSTFMSGDIDMGNNNIINVNQLQVDNVTADDDPEIKISSDVSINQQLKIYNTTSTPTAGVDIEVSKNEYARLSLLSDMNNSGGEYSLIDFASKTLTEGASIMNDAGGGLSFVSGTTAPGNGNMTFVDGTYNNGSLGFASLNDLYWRFRNSTHQCFKSIDMGNNSITVCNDIDAQTLSLAGLSTDPSERAIYINTGTNEIHYRDWEYEYALSSGVSSTTSAVYINKLTLTTATLPAGTYRVEIAFQYTNSSAGSDTLVELTEQEGAGSQDQIFETHLPVIIANNDYQTCAFWFNRTLNNAAHSYRINYLANANTASIRQAKIAVRRLI